MPAPPVAREKLDAIGIDGVVALILEGKSKPVLCAELGIGQTTFYDWVAADPERRARLDAADEVQSEWWDHKAEVVLTEAKTKLGIAKARELAHHYRWRAKVQNRRRYGDQVAVDANVQVSNLSDAAIDARMAAIAKRLADAGAAEVLPADVRQALNLPPVEGAQPCAD